jgi:hypothetical protein
MVPIRKLSEIGKFNLAYLNYSVWLVCYSGSQTQSVEALDELRHRKDALTKLRRKSRFCEP